MSQCPLLEGAGVRHTRARRHDGAARGSRRGRRGRIARDRILRMREILQDAQDYGVNRTAFLARQRRDYARARLDLEALQPVLKGQIPLAVQANRASDLLAAIRLADEFKLRLVLVGAAEGWMVAEQLAKARVPVVVKPLTDIPSFDSLGATLENPARLAKAGVTLALATFDTQNSRNLRQDAGNAIANGRWRISTGLSRSSAGHANVPCSSRLYNTQKPD